MISHSGDTANRVRTGSSRPKTKIWPRTALRSLTFGEDRISRRILRSRAQSVHAVCRSPVRRRGLPGCARGRARGTGGLPSAARGHGVPGHLRGGHRLDARHRRGRGHAHRPGLPAHRLCGAGRFGDGAGVPALSGRRRAGRGGGGPAARPPGAGRLRPGQCRADRGHDDPRDPGGRAARPAVRQRPDRTGLPGGPVRAAARRAAAWPRLRAGPVHDAHGRPVGADRRVRRGRGPAGDRVPPRRADRGRAVLRGLGRAAAGGPGRPGAPGRADG